MINFTAVIVLIISETRSEDKRTHGCSAVERAWRPNTASQPGAAARGFIGLCSHMSLSNVKMSLLP